MFRVTQRVFVNNLLFQPNVLYQGQPNGISPRYCEVLENEAENEAIQGATATPKKHKRKRAKTHNVAITNGDKE